MKKKEKKVIFVFMTKGTGRYWWCGVRMSVHTILLSFFSVQPSELLYILLYCSPLPITQLYTFTFTRFSFSTMCVREPFISVLVLLYVNLQLAQIAFIYFSLFFLQMATQNLKQTLLVATESLNLWWFKHPLEILAVPIILNAFSVLLSLMCCQKCFLVQRFNKISSLFFKKYFR